MEDRQSGSQPKDISLSCETTYRWGPPEGLQPFACAGLSAVQYQPDSLTQTGRSLKPSVQYRWCTEVWLRSPCPVLTAFFQALTVDSVLAAGKFAQNRRNNAQQQKARHPRLNQQLQSTTQLTTRNGADAISEHDGVDVEIEQWAGPAPDE